MSEAFAIRRATLADVPTIVRQRRLMFEEMGEGTPETLQRMDEAFAPWLACRIERGEYLGWFVTDEAGTPASGLGLWVLLDWPAGPVDATGRRAYLMNVYTAPAYRGRGFARRLAQTAIAWAREKGIITVLLHASDAGRPIYEKLGFRQTNEMRYLIPTATGAQP
ncbi:MAG: GNAT family N-acetyltransferase [Chloroflexota bacterium]|nr:MAG: GNAT family N-acetyltransferase [Chloroflexota bacterium]